MSVTVSVVIVNHNGRKWLEGCLSSLRSQTYRDFEVILVDNASKDKSVDFVSRHHADVILVSSKSNLGFAGGNNLGIGVAKGEYVLLLNNDTRMDSDFLENIVRAFDEIPNLGAVSAKIVLMDDPEKLDNCGSFATSTGFLYHYGYLCDESLDEYNKPFPVFYNNGAAMLIRSDLLDEFGSMDDDFWCYNEEGDLCHRLWLAGFECWYYPRARVLHAKGGTSSELDSALVQFHNFKNRLLTYMKNYEIRTLIKVVPVHIFLNILLSFYYLLRGKRRLFSSVYRGIWWNLVNIRRTLKKRNIVQSYRVRSDKELSSTIKKNPGLSYYLEFLAGAR